LFLLKDLTVARRAGASIGCHDSQFINRGGYLSIEPTALFIGPRFE